MINVFVFVCVFLEGSRISDEVPDRLCPRLDVSGRLFLPEPLENHRRRAGTAGSESIVLLHGGFCTANAIRCDPSLRYWLAYRGLWTFCLDTTHDRPTAFLLCLE